jgi:dolichyl-phosphate-mannose-protein mannosyltransferase
MAKRLNRNFTQRDWLIVGLLTLVAGLFRFINLHYPAAIVFDETYFAKFAHDYLTNTPFFDAEPPLAKFLIAGGEWLFKSDPNTLTNPFGWRFATAVFGTAVIPMMYLFAKRLFGGFVVPCLAAIFALLDGLLLVESRVAVIDIFVVFFNLLTYTLFLMHLQAKDRARSILLLTATGISFGLALSVKWITLAFIATAAMVLAVLYLAKRRWVKRLFKVRSAQALFDAIGAKRTNLQGPFTYLMLLAVLPAALYVVIFSFHVPFDSTKEGIWGIHQQIYNYHHNLMATHPYGSAWWSWPLLIRPVVYYFNAANGQWAGILALGNPVLWWGGLAAVGYAAVRAWKSRALPLLIILFAFVAHFAPWALIPRVLFIYHYLGALPFVFLALAYVGGESWRWRPKDASLQLFGWILLTVAAAILGGLLGWSLVGASGGLYLGGVLAGIAMIAFAILKVGRLTWGQKQVIAFASVALLAFFYFLPLWTGIPLDISDYNHRFWLNSWI